MDFFDNYLKRLDQDGSNFQERVISRREKKFARFLNRSIYRSTEIVLEDNTKITGSLQPTKDSEKTCLYTLLTLKEVNLQSGQLITVHGTTWIITHKTLDRTLGHNTYTLMLLPTILTIINGEENISFPGRITNDSAAMIEDFFSTMTGTTRQYREPDRNIKVICKNYNFLKKDLKFVIEGDTYKIEGINKTAVPGCVYLTLGQCLTDKTKDDGNADNTNTSFWGND